MKGAKRYNCRQRKKLRVGEFQEMGFEFSAELASDALALDRDDLIDSFLDEAVEANALLMGGGINDGVLAGFIISGALRGSVTPEQRQAVEQWLQASSIYENVQVRPLRDAWHGWS
ncbi:YggL family protein [Cupriavidus basilensis]|uniref:YggL 50S ribosome-binding family protein n=1 Tax=Cupriavidus basilensis TaxID=68895 RepID=UPI00157BA681|nr:YggL family protein [Cupriavidus basilensis]NUA31004.1 DUF469 family protein [Cupriavidus basilensis]